MSIALLEDVSEGCQAILAGVEQHTRLHQIQG